MIDDQTPKSLCKTITIIGAQHLPGHQPTVYSITSWHACPRSGKAQGDSTFVSTKKNRKPDQEAKQPPVPHGPDHTPGMKRTSSRQPIKAPNSPKDGFSIEKLKKLVAEFKIAHTAFCNNLLKTAYRLIHDARRIGDMLLEMKQEGGFQSKRQLHIWLELETDVTIPQPTFYRYIQAAEDFQQVEVIHGTKMLTEITSNKVLKMLAYAGVELESAPNDAVEEVKLERADQSHDSPQEGIKPGGQKALESLDPRKKWEEAAAKAEAEANSKEGKAQPKKERPSRAALSTLGSIEQGLNTLKLNLNGWTGREMQTLQNSLGRIIECARTLLKGTKQRGGQK
jgi:hypothetical protein